MIIFNRKIDFRQIITGVIAIILVASGFPFILSSKMYNKELRSTKEDQYSIKSNPSLLINDSEDLQGSTSILFKKWREKYNSYDHNRNNLNDALDKKLDLLRKIEQNQTTLLQGEVGLHSLDESKPSSVTQQQNANYTQNNKTTVIVQFPEKFQKRIINIFKYYNGEVIKIYTEAINGFLGKILTRNLLNFTETLRSKELPFFIEEDQEVKTNLYYTGRNMNLRPYVWNTLGYDGDEWSSIAVIDTGIDDSHNFHDGFKNASFDHKIVGWKDFINTSTTEPYDDNSHGTHVSGIAAGDGNNPTQSENYRYFFTKNFLFNGTGKDYYNGTYSIDLVKFNLLNDTKDISVEYWFDDYTKASDDMNLTAILLYNKTVIHSYTDQTQDDWYSNRINGIETNGSIGTYTLRLNLTYIDGDGDGIISSPDISFRGLIYWPFEPDELNSGNIFRGVANDTHLVGIKALDESGTGSISGIIDSIEWAISNKEAYNITIISMSLGTNTLVASIDNAVNYAVEEGILVVVAAGNAGPENNYVASPASAENSIAVAATNYQDNITFYSSEGGDYDSKKVFKPDIAAPGGSTYLHNLFSSDTNDNDAEGLYSERISNDLTPLQGTSMATPAVSGAANLLIEAMGGHENWEYSESQTKLVKALLLMTATETYPLRRETYNSSFSPHLNRGGKDPHEGYGRINIDMAIEALTKKLETNTTASKFISSSFLDPFAPHGLARSIELDEDKAYTLTLTTPVSTDFDLYLYKNESSEYGEPILLDSSNSPKTGEDEEIHISPESSGTYYIVAKAISGQGTAKIKNDAVEDLAVNIRIPNFAQVNKSYIINAELEYLGEKTEYNTSFTFLLDGVILNSTIIPRLNSGDMFSFRYNWTPHTTKAFNFTAYTGYLSKESNTFNNRDMKIMFSRLYFFYEDFEDDLSKWMTIEDEWHITNDSTGRPNSSYSPIHSIWHGNESTGYYSNEYDHSNALLSVPINLSYAGSELFLEFHHWREALNYWDRSYITIYAQKNYGPKVEFVRYFNQDIDPWSREIFNISSLAGEQIQLRFWFSISESYQQFRGWYLDDIKIYGNLDDIPPTWIEEPMNQTAYETRSFSYDLNATDPTGIDRYWINDTLNFKINNNGLLTNNGSYEEGIYWLEIRSYDSYNNYISAKIKITVEPPIQFIPGYEPIIMLSVLGITSIMIVLIKRSTIEK